MSWFKRSFGLDAVDLFIHVAVTFVLVGWAVEANEDEMVFILVTTSLVVLGIRRWLAFRKMPPSSAGMISGDTAAARVHDLEQRIELLEGSEARIAELEERLDFAERMLAQSHRERSGGLPAHRD